MKLCDSLDLTVGERVVMRCVADTENNLAGSVHSASLAKFVDTSRDLPF